MLTKTRIVFLIVLFYIQLTFTQPKPNIVLLFSDDAGYADFGFNGTQQFRTPKLDEMAKNGIQFTNGYVSGCVCHPSRAGLLTGRNQVRFGHHFNPAGTNADLPESEITLAEHLKKADYKTMIVGKWHLGKTISHPQKRGFDEFYGFLNGNTDYFNSNGIEHNGNPVNNHPYLTDAFGEKAVEFIERNQNDPFFIFVSFSAVHTPNQARKEHKELFNYISNKTRRTVAAMTWALDSACGEILDKIDELGIAENTLVFFINDNGGVDKHRKNDPFSGKKSTHLDGGVRVPFLLQWKGKLPGGTKYEYPVSTLDLFATVNAVAELDLPQDRKYDGINLIPFITGQNTNRPQKYLHWDKWFRGMRYLDYKLITFFDGRGPCLYDLSTDVAEKNNLATKLPGLTTTLLKYMDRWFAENSIEPLFVEDSSWFHDNLKKYEDRGIGVNFIPKDTNIVLEKETEPGPVAIKYTPNITKRKKERLSFFAGKRGGVLFQIPQSKTGILHYEIYTLKGTRVTAAKVDVSQDRFYWNGKNEKGVSVSSGLYLLKIVMNGQVKLTVLFSHGLHNGL